MREPDRLNSFYDELKAIHMKNFPDWRFGQLCYNLIQWLLNEKDVDVFFPEEDRMLKYIHEFADFMQGA